MHTRGLVESETIDERDSEVCEGREGAADRDEDNDKVRGQRMDSAERG